MTDSSDRKTLTLKAGVREGNASTPRQRTGARAWKVARRQLDTRAETDDVKPTAEEQNQQPSNERRAPRNDQRGYGQRTDRDTGQRGDRLTDRRHEQRADQRTGYRNEQGTDRRNDRRNEQGTDRRTDRRNEQGTSHRNEQRPDRRNGQRSEQRPDRRNDPRSDQSTGPHNDRRSEHRSDYRRDSGAERRPFDRNRERPEGERHETRPLPGRAPLPPQNDTTRQSRPRGSRHLARDTHHYPAFASCPQGMEAVLAQELQALGFDDVQAGRAGVHFRTDWLGMMRANLHSRLATRILIQVAQAPVSHEDDLLRLAHDTPWERWFGPEQTLRVDTSAIRSPMQSLQYCTLRTKDGICDRLREREGARPSIDTVRPDARVHVFLNETTATLYLDTSGESLFKRGWRLDKGEAPLRENLAAGMLALSGWPGDCALVDPFCGSGTILIEAAYQALRVPPGISRPFAFERLRHHDPILWRKLKEDARRQILPQLTMPLIGSDLSPAAIAAARANAARAGLTDDAITFEVRDAVDIRPPAGEPGWIVTNPPYGARLPMHDRRQPSRLAEDQLLEEHSEHADGSDPTIALWQEFSKTLKGHFDGWQAHIITTDRDLPRHLRLSAARRTPLYNGALDCRFFSFNVVTGTYRQRI